MTQGKSLPFEGIIKKRKVIDEAKFPEYNKFVEEKKEKKYKQLEFDLEFDEDLVSPI